VVLLLRHASAGERLSSPDLDRERSLDAVGRVDARRLPETLAGYVFDRIVTSPYPRCVETVGPLAARLGVRVELLDELAPGAPARLVGGILDELRHDSVLACTHREAFEALFGGGVTCDKGGGWILERRRVGWHPVTYVAPPSDPRRAAVLAGSR